MISDKKTVGILAGILKSHGVKNIVISPGSRNAPVIISFAGDEYFNCKTIVDERSAAFFAMGMAHQTGDPVALVCTSGSAVLNYAPAVAEAFYRHIPLLVISADRPPEMIDQGDGQMIHQSGVLDDHLNYSCTLPSDVKSDDDLWYVNRMINEAVINCHVEKSGPVHINIPFREPLYGKTDITEKAPRAINFLKPENHLTERQLTSLATIWNSSSKIMILLGESRGSKELYDLLNAIGRKKQAVILTETLTNITGEEIFPCIDRIVSTITDEEVPLFQPDLLITTGGAVVSKMIKTFLRDHPPGYHWQVSEEDPVMDTYKNMTHAIPVDIELLLKGMLSLLEEKETGYFDLWRYHAERIIKQHKRYLNDIPWSDLKVFSVLKNKIPGSYIVHWGNSTVVRYVQLFEEFYAMRNYSNRGTSGIDGSVSTAVGAACASHADTLLVTGDLSFMYDSNGLWNRYVSPKLKVIVINNGGGGIFRFIPGSSDSEYLEDFFEAGHTMSVRSVVEMYGLDYLRAENNAELEKSLTQLFDKNEKAVVLEVVTPGKENAKVLRRYFEFLKELR